MFVAYVAVLVSALLRLGRAFDEISKSQAGHIAFLLFADLRQESFSEMVVLWTYDRVLLRFAQPDVDYRCFGVNLTHKQHFERFALGCFVD